MRRLAGGVGVDLLGLEDARLATYGLSGSAPTLDATPFLGSIVDPEATYTSPRPERHADPLE